MAHDGMIKKNIITDSESMAAHNTVYVKKRPPLQKRWLCTVLGCQSR